MVTSNEALSSPPQLDTDALNQLILEARFSECLERAEQLLLLYPDAWILHAFSGTAHVGLGWVDKAVVSYELVTKLEPNYAIAWVDLANALVKAGRLEESVPAYRKGIQLQPSNAVAHNNCASVLYQLQCYEESLECSRIAVALAPEFSDAHFNLGNALKDMLHLPEALASYDRAIELRPDYSMAYCNRAMILADLGDVDAALAGYDRSIELFPELVPALINRGLIYMQLNCTAKALADCESVLRIQPHSAVSWFNRGNVLSALKRDDEAFGDYSKAIELFPQYVDAFNNRGHALVRLNRLDEALADYEAAIDLNPDYSPGYINRGLLLRDLNRLNEALISLNKAIALTPDVSGAYYNRGIILVGLGRLEESIVDFDKAMELDPGDAKATSQMIYQRAHTCDWSDVVRAVDFARLGIDGEEFSPLALLAAEDNPAHHLARALKWSLRAQQPSGRFVFARPAAKDKIRLGYFSADFNNHAVMYLIGRLFEVHDKEKFDIQAFSFGLDGWDGMRQRVHDAVNCFHDVARLSDASVAQLAREQGIDIAIDLNGYTQDERPGIFAHHAAPIQINYLGYPGSMGASFIDYIIADDMLIPPQFQQFYSEKIIYLPHCYQANDDLRPISDTIFSRMELGLPESGFIFCCINANFKISPVEFDIWMRLLGRIDGSVLWLLQCNRWAATNLRKEAATRGIDPARIIFAPKLVLSEHLARHRAADLFLDTFNYNAHTTGSDALWAGLPFVTMCGQSFAARVGASLLRAVGLEELITNRLDDYEHLALHLATHQDELTAIRQRLANSRLTAPLFDSTGFARQIEDAYEQVYKLHCDGLSPDHIWVQA